MQFPVPRCIYSIALGHASSVFGLALIVVIAGCDSERPVATPGQTAVLSQSDTAPMASIQFTNITEKAGIKFKHTSGAFGAKLLPESMGSGVVFIDYDSDGYQDLFFVNSRHWTDAEVAAYQQRAWAPDEIRFIAAHEGQPTRAIPANRPKQHTSGKLFRNNRNGKFEDVTQQAKLDVEMYGMGATVGDYNNDSKPDLFITALGRSYLFKNEGGKFRDVTAKIGLRDTGWSTSAAWLDYDKDGLLDLFVCHYLKWSPATDVFTSVDHKVKTYTGPQFYKGEASRLYHNTGSKFVDVSLSAGITQRIASSTRAGRKLTGKALGVAVCDYNNDTWPDILVANDKVRNYLFKNNANGTFTEVAKETGVAYSSTGEARAGMGIDAADIDGSGHDGITIGNGNDEMLALFQYQNDGSYVDIANRSEIAAATLKAFTFGNIFCDVDNDGRLDILIANGHIREEIQHIDPAVTYMQRPLLFRNLGQGRFKEIGLQCGDAFKQPIVARGLACGDIDLDGDVDAVFTTTNGPPLLLRNEGGNMNRSLRISLEGAKSNRSAIGAVLQATVGNKLLRRTVRSGSSYLSQSELPITIGLGQAERIDQLTIRWPSGKTLQFKHIPANHSFLIHEDRGIIRKSPF